MSIVYVNQEFPTLEHSVATKRLKIFTHRHTEEETVSEGYFEFGTLYPLIIFKWFIKWVTEHTNPYMV